LSRNRGCHTRYSDDGGERADSYTSNISTIKRQLFHGEDLHDFPIVVLMHATNCTTTIFDMARAVSAAIPFDWGILLTGYLPSYFYDRGVVDKSMSLDELSRRADVNARIDEGLTAVDFSSSIRNGVLPRVDPDDHLGSAGLARRQS
jgi:hypothetical protein